MDLDRTKSKSVSITSRLRLSWLLMIAGSLLALSLLAPIRVMAQSASQDTGEAACNQSGIQILPKWYKYVKQQSVDGQCELQFDFPEDIGIVLLAIVEILLRVAAIVAVGFIIYGGFMYMTSQGEPDKAKNAQQAITNAVIGLVIALLATGLVAFIGGQLAK